MIEYASLDPAAPLALDRDEVLARLQLSADFADELDPFIERTLNAARPMALLGEAPITAHEERRIRIGDLWQDSRVLAVNLEGASLVLPYVATCGVELQALADACADPLERFWQDQLNEMVLGYAMARLERDVRARYGDDHRYAMNPGSVPGWPIDALRDVFAWLPGVTEATGVWLTDSCLMMPVKSVSGIFFRSDKEYANCQICPRQCRNRRMAFDEALAASFYA